MTATVAVVAMATAMVATETMTLVVAVMATAILAKIRLKLNALHRRHLTKINFMPWAL